MRVNNEKSAEVIVVNKVNEGPNVYKFSKCKIRYMRKDGKAKGNRKQNLLKQGGASKVD